MTYTLIAMPILYCWSFIVKVHTIPNDDYWKQFFDYVLVKHTTYEKIYALFTSRFNDHLVIIPNIINYLNYLICNGSNIGLFIIDGLIMMLIFFILASWIKRSFDHISWHYLMPLLSISLFAPIIPMTWFRSFSGIYWLTANLLLVSTIECFIRFLESDKKFGWFIALCLCSLFCVVTYSSVLGVFFLILLYFIFNTVVFKQKYLIHYNLIYFSIALVVYIAWIWDYTQRPSHTVMIVVNHSPSLLKIIEYIFMYFGSIFTSDYKVSIIYGVLGMAVYALCTTFIINRGFLKNNYKLLIGILPWHILSTGVLLFALLISKGRYFLRPPSESMFISFARYNNLTVLFWVGLIFMTLVIFNVLSVMPQKRRIFLPVGIATIILCICIPMYINGFEQYQIVLNRYRYADYAGLSLQIGIHDREEFNHASTEYFFKPFQSYENDLKRLSHVPYDKILIPEYRYNAILNTTSIIEDDNNICKGSIQSSKQISATAIKLFGKLGMVASSKKNKKLKYVLIANEQGAIRGGGMVDRLDRTSWIGYAKLPGTDAKREIIYAYARLEDGTLCKLKGSQILDYLP